ncbi:hypothetical protein GBA63_19595 [Rubrobacter tropicus]|uniref:Uncharacterized protein n=1 Tax=Rubrobacter tropicus TaxID=2653851 RepID=A0A6G8QDM7_9ACTN|nr:hypothetical protein [Rubrobacter tropicus]QIN84605.1 hypothetical protein GBA63_19595 [Rubrobacter tropicus]
MGGTTGVVLAVAVLFSIVGALAYPTFVIRRGKHLRGWVSGLSGRARERARLRIAAALLDLGNHLMLCDEERKARRLEKRLSGHRTRRLGLEAAALRLGATRADEVTLELPVGSREQEGNPSRTLAISCVVHHPPRGEYPVAQDGDCTTSWRVVNRPSPGYRGPSSMCEVPSLERALVAYHARPLRPLSKGRRFLDEDVHYAGGIAGSPNGCFGLPEAGARLERVEP